MTELISTLYPAGAQYVLPTAPLGDIIYLLRRDGAVFVRGLVAPADVDLAYEEVKQELDGSRVWKGSFFPEETRRAQSLIALSPTYARTQVMNPIFQAVCDSFLTTRSHFWWGDEFKESISRPYISSTTALRVGPGARAQPLHRDDYVNHNILGDVSNYDEKNSRRDSSINLFVAGCKVTKQNGATRFIPGSHLWATDRIVPPDISQCAHAEMEKGDAFIFLCSVYHGAGSNTTTDEHRTVFSTCATRGYLRQEENQFLAVPIEIAKGYDRDTQAFMGYSLSDPVCGHVREMDPIYVLRPEEVDIGPRIDF